MMEPKIDKNTRLLREMDKFLPRLALIIIYKAFVSTHLDDGNMTYDEAYNALCHLKLELYPYRACLAMTGTITGTHTEKFTMNYL